MVGRKKKSKRFDLGGSNKKNGEGLFYYKGCWAGLLGLDFKE